MNTVLLVHANHDARPLGSAKKPMGTHLKVQHNQQNQHGEHATANVVITPPELSRRRSRRGGWQAKTCTKPTGTWTARTVGERPGVLQDLAPQLVAEHAGVPVLLSAVAGHAVSGGCDGRFVAALDVDNGSVFFLVALCSIRLSTGLRCSALWPVWT